MNLPHIACHTCPQCGAQATHEHLSERTHVNGGRWETRTFACGLSLSYVPNFSAVETEGECIRSAEHQAKIKKREKLYSAIRAVIAESDADEYYKTNLVHSIVGYKP